MCFDLCFGILNGRQSVKQDPLFFVSFERTEPSALSPMMMVEKFTTPTGFKPATNCSRVQYSTHVLNLHCHHSPSPRVQIHLVGMLQFMSDINQPSVPTPFLKIIPPTVRFLTLFFRFYLCHIGPFNFISLYLRLLLT